MAFVINNKVQFNHIPKTGGSFVTEIFRPVTTVRGVKHAVNDNGDGFINVCVIREPADWFRSYWNWKAKKWKKHEGKDITHPTRNLWKYRAKDLDTFVRNVYKKNPGFLSKMYAKYISDCEHVFRYEYLEEAVQDISYMAGVPLPIEYIKGWGIVNPAKINHDYADSDTVQLIRDSEKGIYKRFYPEY